MIKVLYGDDVDLENFEYGCEYYDLHDIQDWESDYIETKDLEDLIYVFANILRFEIKDNEIEVHIVNKVGDGDMELFGKDVEKDLEIKVGNTVIRFENNILAYVNRDGKLFNNPNDIQRVRDTDCTYLAKSQIEYDLFMVRAYGDDFKKLRLRTMNKDLYAKRDIERLNNESKKIHGTNV